MIGVQTIGNATLVAYDKLPILSTDPWMGGDHSANFGSWRLPYDIPDNIRQDILGSEYLVKNRFEQHEFLYKIMKSEKLAVFLILTFILILATFNSVASVTMIIFDKQKDIGILSSMGAKNSAIKSIFLTEGILINMIGNLSGLIFGILICYLQSTYGLIKFEGNFVTESIPVHVDWIEVTYIFGTVFLIGLFAAWIPTRKIKPLYLG